MYSSNFLSDTRMNDILGERETPHPFEWEEESRDSQEDGSSLLQTSMDDRDDSSNSVGVGGASVSPPPHSRLTSRERLVLRLRRIHDTYYMVEDTDHPGYLNYSHIRSDGKGDIIKKLIIMIPY